MTTKTIQNTKVTIIAILVLLGGSPITAQTKFLANFDDNGVVNQGQLGPSNLIAQGWSFRVQGASLPVQGFVDGFTNFFTQEQGSGYLASFAVMQTDGAYSAWTIVPAVSGQAVGDPLTFWVEGITDKTTTLEARYSPRGGTSTGTTATSVGDFTTLLLTVRPIANGGWQPVQVLLPGSGRIAIRVLGREAFSSGPYVGIDTLTVGDVPSPPCNLPPIPGSGQTTTWTLAKSPYQVCTDLAIPKGGTAVVEPGVQLQFQAHSLAVNGTLNAQGLAASRISMPANAGYPPAISMYGGNVYIAFSDIGGQVRPGPGRLAISDSSFSGNGSIFTLDILLPSLPPVISLTRCTFTNTLAEFTDSYLALKDSRFVNTDVQILRGYARLLGTNTFDGKPLAILRETAQSVQPLFVDGVHASNVFTAGGISLTGGNFLLGPNNRLQGNLYPVDIEGGLLPSSVMPRTGNTNNLIWAHDGAAGPVARWPKLGLPYLVDGYIFGGGTLTIDPGVRVLFDATKAGFAGLNFVGTRRLIANGLPSSPITFDALNPAIPWNGLLFQENYTEGNRLDYVTVQNAGLAFSSSDSFVEVTNSLLQQNQVAANTNTFGSANMSKTRVFNNGIGVQTTPEGSFVLNAPDLLPNWFQGNGTGVSSAQNTIPAQNNYWGSATGPTNPNNPGGQGDKIVGPVTFKPFLTAPPDITTNPPIVRIMPLGNSWYGIDTIARPPEFVAMPGEKLILQWTVSNSTMVASQRILLSPEAAIFDSSTRQPIVLADNIPANTRSLEITTPSIPFAATNLPQFLRVIAIDSAGQQGWDQTPIIVPTGNVSGNIQITSNYAGKVFVGGHVTPTETWSGIGSGGSTEGYIFLESDGGLFPTLGTLPLPIVSTDTARQVVLSHNNSNDLVWFFSPGYFSIRPDPALGLQAPVVTLTSPTAGQSFAGGSTVPIKWTASAQQGLRSFDLQYSTNSGLTWHFITQGLSAPARSFNWELPASTGISDVRVRVIARDKVFQNSSDGAATVFSIRP